MAIIVISSEHPEMSTLSERSLIMHEGRVKADLVNLDLTQEQAIKVALKE
ncbi:MAG: hypothetical protein ACSLEL_00595 [Candidatus Malihini olakiniferum]